MTAPIKEAVMPELPQPAGDAYVVWGGQPGSTGIHRCTYSGEWPNGSWWVHDGDTWPARPVLWRPRKPDDPVVDHGLCCASLIDSEAGSTTGDEG